MLNAVITRVIRVVKGFYVVNNNTGLLRSRRSRVCFYKRVKRIGYFTFPANGKKYPQFEPSGHSRLSMLKLYHCILLGVTASLPHGSVNFSVYCRLPLYFHVPREVGGGSPFGAGAEHVASVGSAYDRMHAAVVAGLLAAAHELFAVQGRRHKVRFERTE